MARKTLGDYPVDKDLPLFHYSLAWLFLPVRGLEMKQVNTFGLYELGTRLQTLRQIPTDLEEFTKDESTHHWSLWAAQYWLKQFMDAKSIPLEVSEDAAKVLSGAINNILVKLTKKEQIDGYELQRIPDQLTTFEHVLAAELQRHLTYLVNQIGGYSMSLLVSKAEVNLPEDAVGIIPDTATKDFREAGRCLAFELPTAAGVHAMRATESVLREYYSLVFKKNATKIDWGTCTQDLKKANANKKVVQVLDQIRDLHRNPLMHPEDFLNMKEAVGLFDIAKSAIGAMAEEINLLKKTLSSAPLLSTTMALPTPPKS